MARTAAALDTTQTTWAALAYAQASYCAVVWRPRLAVERARRGGSPAGGGLPRAGGGGAASRDRGAATGGVRRSPRERRGILSRILRTPALRRRTSRTPWPRRGRPSSR